MARIIYKYCSSDGVFNEPLHAICFSAIYNRLNTVDKMIIYHIKSELGTNKYEFHGDDTYTSIVGEELKQYLSILKEWGFKFEFNENDNYDKKEAHSYTINIKDNSIVVNKILINCIRYTHEHNFPGIIRTFLRIYPEESIINTFTKFMLAHNYARLGNNNHTFVPYSYFVFPIKDEDFEELILKNNLHTSICELLPQSSHKIGDYYGNMSKLAVYLRKALNNGTSVNEIMEMYNKEIKIIK